MNSHSLHINIFDYIFGFLLLYSESRWACGSLLIELLGWQCCLIAQSMWNVWQWFFELCWIMPGQWTAFTKCRLFAASKHSCCSSCILLYVYELTRRTQNYGIYSVANYLVLLCETSLHGSSRLVVVVVGLLGGLDTVMGCPLWCYAGAHALARLLSRMETNMCVTRHDINRSAHRPVLVDLLYWKPSIKRARLKARKHTAFN